MIILASQSASRRAMLEQAGVAFEAIPARIDERSLETQLVGAEPGQVALSLAGAKALAVSGNGDGRLVLGSDSLVVVDGRRFDKPASREEAAEHLRFFSGKGMQLHSAAALARNGAVEWETDAMASLQIIEMSDEFIENYLSVEWPAVAGCVGVFRIESRGVQLFEKIEGDYFTVLGMPLLPVLSALRQFGELPQ
ncbi:MAG: Maf family protein [Novosphingobium sp.]|nr:Maf family protein [Novosphingobium sp.]